MSALHVNENQQKFGPSDESPQQRTSTLRNAWNCFSAYLSTNERLSRTAGAVATDRSPVAMVINEAMASTDTDRS